MIPPILEPLLARLRAITLIVLTASSGLKAFSIHYYQCATAPSCIRALIPPVFWIITWGIAATVSALAILIPRLTVVALSYTMTLWIIYAAGSVISFCEWPVGIEWTKALSGFNITDHPTSPAKTQNHALFWEHFGNKKKF